jgi:hypothetical protein
MVSRSTALAAAPYMAAAVGLPILALARQPSFCIEHVFLPYRLAALILLRLTCAAVQKFLPWWTGARVAVGCLFVPAVLAQVAVPCVSDLEDYLVVQRLLVVTWYLTWLVAAILVATAIAIMGRGQSRVARSVTAMGLAIAGGGFAIAAIKYYLTMNGSIAADVFAALTEMKVPLWLIVGVPVAGAGAAFAHAQQWHTRAREGTP